MGVNEQFDEMLDTIDIQYDYLEDYAEKVYIEAEENKDKADSVINESINATVQGEEIESIIEKKIVKEKRDIGKDISIIDFINESDFLDAEGPSIMQPSE